MNIHVKEKPDYLVTVETQLNNIAWHLQVCKESNSAPADAVIKMHIKAAHCALMLHENQ
jgi:hypothetical protein